MQRKQSSAQIYLSLCGLALSYVIWSAAAPVIKLTLNYIPPFTFLFVRFLIVCLILLPFTLYLLSKHKVNKEDYSKFLLLGLFSQSSLILIFLGLKYTTAIDSALIGTLGPLLSVAAGHYLYKDKVNLGLKIGVLLATIGTSIVVLEPVLTFNSSNHQSGLRIFGNILVIAYNLMFLMYILWSKISFGQTTKTIKKTLRIFHMKPMSKHYPPDLLMSIAFYIGLATTMPFALLENFEVFGPVDYSIANLGTTAVIGILFMSLLSSIVAYFTFEWALKKVTVSDTAILAYMQTIFTIPFAYILLSELPTKFGILGGMTIALGVALAETSIHKFKS